MRRFFNKKVAIITFVSLTVALLILLALYRLVIYPSGEASGNTVPKNVKIVDKASNSFAVTWTTENPAVGKVIYGTSADGLDNEAFDERAASTKFNSHYVVLRNLEPETQYYFKIVSDGTTYSNNGQPYSQSTFAVASLPPSLETVRGVAKDSSGSALPDSLVYLTLVSKDSSRSAVSQILGTVTNSSGGWTFALNLRTADGSRYIFNVADYYSKIEIFSAEAGSGTKIGDISDDFGEVVAGQTTDGAANGEYVPVSSSGSVSEGETEQEDGVEDNALDADEDTENSLTGNCTPLDLSSGAELSVGNEVEGWGLEPGTTVHITIESPVIVQDSVVVNSDGTWRWSIPSGLSSGRHTLSVDVTMADGTEQTVTRVFYITAGVAPSTSVKIWHLSVIAFATTFLGGLFYCLVAKKSWEEQVVGLFE